MYVKLGTIQFWFLSGNAGEMVLENRLSLQNAHTQRVGKGCLGIPFGPTMSLMLLGCLL